MKSLFARWFLHALTGFDTWWCRDCSCYARTWSEYKQHEAHDIRTPILQARP